MLQDLCYVLDWFLVFQYLKLTFITVDLESERDCKYDKILVYTARNSWHPYCGKVIPSSIYTYTNALYLDFTSDHTVEGVGFNISWTATSMTSSKSLQQL